MNFQPNCFFIRWMIVQAMSSSVTAISIWRTGSSPGAMTSSMPGP
jgi:hypothetical protein